MTSARQPADTLNALMRSLPSMNVVLDALQDAASQADGSETAMLCAALTSSTPRPLLREAIDDFLDKQRAVLRRGYILRPESLDIETLLPHIARHAAQFCTPHLRKVINATGVVIHTNLGRSLLAEEAADAVVEAARHYSNLEFNVETGERGSRYSHVEELICRLTGAEAALVVNNNAAAVLLVLDTLCAKREVVISRGELVEIGGSFRIPAVMEKSGCLLHEVGATNRTHFADYDNAINENTAALMKVHTSNYRIVGFTKSVSRKELADLAHKNGLPLLEDLGSGMLFGMVEFKTLGLDDEPAVRDVLKEGVDIVTFSGDKVLGGPQAGIIAGKAEYIAKIKKNQLGRALRIDKLTLAALEATLRLYLDPDLAKKRIPTLRMLTESKATLCRKAEILAETIREALHSAQLAVPYKVLLRDGSSRVGGGAFPECALPTSLVCVSSPGSSPNALYHALLRTTPPLVARVEHDFLCLDPRTIRDTEMTETATSFIQAFRLLADSAAKEAP